MCSERANGGRSSYHDKGNLATIGRSHAVADIKGIQLSGFLAWVTWLGVHLLYLIGFQNRLLVLLRWMFQLRDEGPRGSHHPRLRDNAAAATLTASEYARAARPEPHVARATPSASSSAADGPFGVSSTLIGPSIRRTSSAISSGGFVIG